MNFYKSQDEALRKTKVLIFYYVLAMIGTALFLYTLCSFILMFLFGGQGEPTQYGSAVPTSRTFWDPQLFFVVTGATFVVILLGWAFKRMQIGDSGDAVAHALGGRPIDPNTRDADERQLINVVEEMAIASGLPVPQVWVMDHDEAINAFAAGTAPGNAVIGVTRGTLQKLSRAELQGVIAHEFSHILNGDMRMNIRLMCMLHGLLLISIIGYTVMRIAFYSGAGHRRSKDEGNLGFVLIAFGIAFVIVGAVGAFFASLIQSAISRQREYLADAYAVEFTMDPSGIGGALKKIGGANSSARLSSPVASEMEHMFLAPSGLFSYGFASHPPLEERISIIEPDWDGNFVSARSRGIQEHLESSGPPPPPQPSLNVAGAALSAVIAGAVEDFGDTSHADMRKGQAVVGGLQPQWIEACHDKYQSQLLIYGLLMAQDEQLHQKEVNQLKNLLGKQASEIAVDWQQKLTGLPSSGKIALIDLCVATLRRLAPEEYNKFIELTRWLIRSDSSVNLFELMLQKLLQRHLDAHFLGTPKTSVRYRSLRQIAHPLNVVMSTLAGVGASGQKELHKAYQEGAALMVENGCDQPSLLPPADCGLDKIEQALDEMDRSNPLVKQQALYVCSKVVMSDGKVTSQEAELLRATADAIGCSIPPFVEMS